MRAYTVHGINTTNDGAHTNGPGGVVVNFEGSTTLGPRIEYRPEGHFFLETRCAFSVTAVHVEKIPRGKR